MPVKIRLQRHGKKQRAFYHIVVADSRAPRDGKFIEKLGVYNPNTNPATIDLNIDAAVQWLHNGAQPTDTTIRSNRRGCRRNSSSGSCCRRNTYCRSTSC